MEFPIYFSMFPNIYPNEECKTKIYFHRTEEVLETLSLVFTDILMDVFTNCSIDIFEFL
jgi:hypothetical protein